MLLRITPALPMSSENLHKYAALLSYDGTSYCGWQKQKGSAAQGAPSIQETFENALKKITQETELKTVGSGRTDSGVHALGQVVHFVLKKKNWDQSILEKALNSQLPMTIRTLAVMPVALDFHAQRSATQKQYSYYFQQGPCAVPHLEPYSWLIKKRLNLKAMQKALDLLKGSHDFKAFQSRGAKPGPTVREIFEAQIHWEELPFPSIVGWSKDPIGFVRMRLIGSGFLKQMVRGIAGTLLQIGEERRKPDCINEILATRDRNLVGPTAPARALWLEKVWYPDLKW